MAGVLVATQRFTSGMSKTLLICCIRSVWIPFGLPYLLSICDSTSDLPDPYVNSEFDIWSFAVGSWRVVLTFVQTVSKIIAKAFIGHLLVSILVKKVLEITSTTSKPHFIWPYYLCMSFFFRSSFVTLTSSCEVLTTTTFPLPHFFLSMYNRRRIFSSLSKT